MDIFSILKALIVMVAITTNIFLALLVYRNNPTSATSRLYGGLSIVINLWLLANYASLLPALINLSIWLIRLSIFFATLMSMLFYVFAHTFPSSHLILSKRKLLFACVATVLTMAVTLSPFAFTKVNIVNNLPEPVAGPGMGLFSLTTTLFSLLAVYTLFKKYRHSIGAEKQQYSYTLVAILILLGLIIATILLPVVILKTNATVSLIPVYTVIFLGITTYAIIRHHLFNIRAVIAKSIAYLFILFTLAGIYSAALFGSSFLFFQGPNGESIRQILSVVLAILLAFTFQSIRRFFDRLTNRIFFRDSYDLEVVLNEIGDTLVAEINLGKILNTSRTILADALKSSFVEFVLFKSDIPTFELSHHTAIQANLKDFVRHVKEQRKDLLVTEDLGSQSSLKRWFLEDGIAVALRLKTQRQIVGYIIFGEKKSGEIYSLQDRRLLTLVANELAIAIQNALRFEEIEKFNLTLQEKVNLATRQLRRTNEKLKALDETKDEFISMASHQLRTPLTSMKGYVSMVMEGDAGKITAQQRKLLDQAFISSQRMVYLIADLLNVSRLRTGKFIIEAVPTNLADVVEGEVDQLRDTAKSRNLTLTYNKPKDFPILMLDETKIRQVMMNFIDNAIYYTPAGGHINVELKDTGKTIEYTVNDDGIGVTKADQHHLFSKFYRAGNAKKARPDGTGLGLFMAKKVIIAQGGSVIFKSEQGKGSTFGFSFEKSKLLPPSQDVAYKIKQ